MSGGEGSAQAGYELLGDEERCPARAEKPVDGSRVAVGLDDLALVLDASPVATLLIDEDRRVVLHNQAASHALNTHSVDLANGRFPHPVGGEPYDLPLLDGSGRRRLHHLVSRPFAGLARAAWLVTLQEGALHADTTNRRVRDNTHDRLTGLANRELLLNRLAEAVRREGPDALERIAVVAIDLDRFGRINEAHGMRTGDLVLRAVANRLTASVGPDDHVSRTGGDEFAVLLAPRRTVDHLDVADQLADVLSQPIEIAGAVHLCSPVLGVAESRPGDDEHLILAAAEEAAAGAVPATPRLARRQLEQLDPRCALRARLPTAAAEGQMFVQYQPMFSMPGHDLVGFEALVRWEHPDDGFIAPEEFIQVAEESGAIVRLGEWVVAEVCDQLAEWRRTAAGYVVPPISINVTSRQIADRDFRHHLLHELRMRDLPPAALRLEVDERVLIRHDPHVDEVIRQLAADGFAIDLDEFGSGTSSLTALLNLPISALKISPSVLTRLMDDPASAKVVAAAIAVGRSFELPVVAVGVQSQDQFSVLQRWQCDRVQGYLLARPLNPLEATRFFDRDPSSMAVRRPDQPILSSGSRGASSPFRSQSTS